MKLPPPSYVGLTSYGLIDATAFRAARQVMFEQIKYQGGIFAADNLITWNKSLDFLRDSAFAEAVNRNARPGAERGVVWRTNTLVWAARQAANLPGDFVECACYRGSTARTVIDMVGITGRKYFLYDLFDHDETMAHHAMPEHSETLFNEVQARFPEPEVIVTQGRVPDSLHTTAPDKIAMIHLDLNNVDAEIGALELLWDRIVPGGVLILDDYGWASYRAQQVAEKAWMAERGQSILELPTGQGLVIKHR